MGRIIAVVGNSGVGKTTVARQLCSLGHFVAGFEQHAERPFQALFSLDHQRYALANQVDYLLLRAEQELSIRRAELDGVIDGGLDQDFYVFTRLFARRGYLGSAEYQLCERTYELLRQVLPAPEVVVYLVAPLEAITARFERRGRPVEIATLQDLKIIQGLLDDWIGKYPPERVITVDASLDDPECSTLGQIALEKMSTLLAL